MKTRMNMKSPLGILAAVALLAPVGASAQTSAIGTVTNVVRRVNVNVQVADQGSNQVVLNGQEAELNAGHLYVPLRSVVERMGYVVDWDQSAQTVVVTQGDSALSLPVAGRTTVNGNPINPGAPAYLSEGKVMVPLRFMAETLGAKVKWDEDTNAVSISRNPSDESLAGH